MRTATKSIAYIPDPDLAFWPTPPDVADHLVYWVLEPWHGRGDGVRVLEPSAGDGRLARAVRDHLPEAHITAVEPSHQRAERLRDGVADEVVESTLEAYLTGVAVAAFSGRWQPFDLVFMNPPFALPGRPEAWAEHVLAIYDDPHLLAPGSVISAVVPRVVLTGKSKLVRAVRGLLSPWGQAEACDRGAFDAVGARVSTAVLWTQKPFGIVVPGKQEPDGSEGEAS